jgi:hypothetical protein
MRRTHYKAVMDGLKAVPFKEFRFFRSLFSRPQKNGKQLGFSGRETAALGI